MLVLSRRENESLIITTPAGEKIVVLICQINPGVVKIGIDARRDVEVVRDNAVEPKKKFK